MAEQRNGHIKALRPQGTDKGTSRQGDRIAFCPTPKTVQMGVIREWRSGIGVRHKMDLNGRVVFLKAREKWGWPGANLPGLDAAE